MSRFHQSRRLLVLCTLFLFIFSSSPALAKRQQKGFWQELWDRIMQTHRNKRVQGSRGFEEVPCLLAPQKISGRYLFLNNQPRFFWKGQVSKIQVKADSDGKNSKSSIIWEKAIRPGQTSVHYDGEPLRPGQIYSLRIAGALGADTLFKVASPSSYGNLRQTFRNLDTWARVNRITDEAHRKKRIQILSRSEAESLPLSFTINELLAIERPSAETQHAQQRLIKQTCEPPDEQTVQKTL